MGCNPIGSKRDFVAEPSKADRRKRGKAGTFQKQIIFWFLDIGFQNGTQARTYLRIPFYCRTFSLSEPKMLELQRQLDGASTPLSKENYDTLGIRHMAGRIERRHGNYFDGKRRP
jgi:hypothetical protein